MNDKLSKNNTHIGCICKFYGKFTVLLFSWSWFGWNFYIFIRIFITRRWNHCRAKTFPELTNGLLGILQFNLKLCYQTVESITYYLKTFILFLISHIKYNSCLRCIIWTFVFNIICQWITFRIFVIDRMYIHDHITCCAIQWVLSCWLQVVHSNIFTKILVKRMCVEK